MGQRQPGCVTVVALIDLVEGVLLGAVGLLPLGRIVQLSLRRGDFSLLDGVLYLAISAVLLIFGYVFVKVGLGVWKLQRWARVPAMLLALLILLLAITGLLTLPRFGGAVFGLCLAGLHLWVVWYLRRTPVKDAFSG